MSEKQLTLSIETAIQGGSISLLQGITELDCWIGFKEISKSEDVLEEIKNILDRNDLKRGDLKRIVVSEGPGSHTGVRIGKAIGIGLRKALNCELIGVFAFEAMLLAGKIKSFSLEEDIIAAVPVGRNQVCQQSFKLKDKEIIYFGTESKLSTLEDFLYFTGNEKSRHQKRIIMHRKLYLDYQANFKDVFRKDIIIDAGENIAVLNGMFGTKQEKVINASTPRRFRDGVFSSL